MVNKPDRTIMIYGIAAALFAALFLATFRPGGAKEEKGQTDILVFGDSVFGLFRDETAVPARLQELTGKSVYNAALGGTGMARQEEDRRLDYGKGSLSLVGLAKAAWAGDFGVQQSARIRESNTQYFPGTIDGLARVDFSGVETVVIQQGINDYHGGVPIENPENPYDEYTFLGALRSSVHALRKANPELRIVLLTPTYSWYLSTGLTCEEADQGGGILEDYVEAEFRAARELDLEIVDLYHDFYPHEKWEDWELYTFDGIHPNEAGREKLAQRIAEVLMGTSSADDSAADGSSGKPSGGISMVHYAG